MFGFVLVVTIISLICCGMHVSEGNGIGFIASFWFAIWGVILMVTS